MIFRVTFSNDIEDYYSSKLNEITVALTVEADSFDGAVFQARFMLSQFNKWVDDFDVVAVSRIEELISEIEMMEKSDTHSYQPGVEGIEIDYKYKQPSQTWCNLTGIEVMDPDGWNRQDYEKSWAEPITRGEFLKRAGISTCKRWPEPLWDRR